MAAPRAPSVLFLTETFHPVLGGGETHIRHLAARLASSGLPTTVLTRHSVPETAREETIDGVRVLRVPPVGAARLGKYAMVPFALGRLMNGGLDFDILVVRGTRVLGLPGLIAGQWRGRRVVLQPEVNGELSGEVYTWGTPLARAPWVWPVRALTEARNLRLRWADAFVAMSRAIEDEMVRAGVPADRVVRIPHGVDTTRFHPVAAAERAALRTKWGLPRDKTLFVYTGRLLRGKGLDILLDAFSGLLTTRPDAGLVLVGAGEGVLSVEAALRERAAIEPLRSHVVFTGRVDRVEEVLAACDVFVFPSLFEALGLSLLEAASCGLPCIGSETGGIVDVIEDGRSGYLVPPGDDAALCGAMERLLSDAAERRALGERGRAIVQAEFDQDRNVAAYRELFTRLAA